MADSEITTKILRQIRDEIIATRTELKSELGDLKAEVAVTNERLDLTNERLSAVERVVTVAAEQIHDHIRHQRTRQDGKIEELRKRVTRLERKVG